MTRALVVGAGISGIACANALLSCGIDVEVRERGRVVGGRMATRTLRDSGTAFDGRVIDFGASYFTVSDPEFAARIDVLIESDVVRTWTDAFHVAGPDGILGVSSGPVRYAAPGGLRSVVAALADPRLDVRLATEVAAVEPGPLPVVDGDEFDAVALCMPTPQAQRILNTVPTNGPSWEPVIAVTCVFAEREWRELDGAFVNDDPVITWIADDGSRRGDGAPVLVVHVHPVLSARHLEDPMGVVPPVIAGIRRILGISGLPAWVDAHRWTFAKPMGASAEPFWIHDGSAVGVAGDAWSQGPRVEAAWLSGHRLGLELADRAGSTTSG